MSDVSKMTNKELKIANVEIFSELRKREDEEEAKLWKNFVNALYAYCEKFGDIELYEDGDTTYLNYSEFDFESSGEIYAKY